MFIRRKGRKQIRVANNLGLYELRIENACKTRADTRFEHTIFMGGHKQCSEGPAQLLAAMAVGHKQMR